MNKAPVPPEAKPYRRPAAYPVGIEMDEENKRLLDQLADRLGLSRAAYLRMLLRADARKRGLLRDQEPGRTGEEETR